jgi:hypothetical protein
MRIKILPFLFIASIAAAETSDYRAFFPLAKGTSWVYDTSDKKKGDHFDMKVQVEGAWKEDDAEGMILTQKDKRGTMREFLTENDHGAFIHKLGLSKSLTPEVYTRFTPDVPRVIAPLTPGTKVEWKGRLKVRMIMDKPIRFSGQVMGWEEVTVPAGKFHCIKLFYDQYRGEDHVQEYAWYAEGVGQVKYDGGQYVKELKEFKKP